jgi:hypothetical protein
MDDTMTSNEVPNEYWPGSLVPLNSWTSDIIVVNPSSICVNLCLVVMVDYGFLCLHVLVWVFNCL